MGSISDNNWWKTNFGHLFDDTKSILKVSLTQSSALSKEQVETYRHVSRVVREAVLDQDLFRFFSSFYVILLIFDLCSNKTSILDCEF